MSNLLALVDARFERSTSVPDVFFNAEAEHIARCCWAMARRFHAGGRLLAFGNGAFASDAQHVAVEFVHPVIVGKRALPALALSSDSAALSGQSFARQLATWARPNDIALGLSPDGRCANIAEALESANKAGLLTVACAGGNGGLLAELPLDHCFVVHDNDPIAVQETHETLYHVLWELVHVFFEHEWLLKEAA